MRYLFVVLAMLVCSITSSFAQVSVSIGINLPVYPQLVRVPGYPVYYAPQVDSNYFFYDGMYWVFDNDNWYASAWYNGPWELVAPDFVPLFVLRVPVRYYRRAPVYFHSWRRDAPPRWGEHWGDRWQQSHRGWDNWNRRAAPPPAPLPVYQRQYSGNRYPQREQQTTLQSRNYRYQPRDAVVRQQYQAQGVQSAPAASPQTRARTTSPQVRESAAAPQPRVPSAQGREPGATPQVRQQRAAPPAMSPQQGARNAAPPRPAESGSARMQAAQPPAAAQNRPQPRDARQPRETAQPSREAVQRPAPPADSRGQPRAVPRPPQAAQAPGQNREPPGKERAQQSRRGEDRDKKND
jgi:hypothetical protein